MKNLLNCHSVGLHSFPISLEHGLYRRVFYATKEHNLWKSDPLEIAIHPHHVDIKITVLKGTLINKIYKIGNELPFKSFKWQSHILNGSGGFEYIDDVKLDLVDETAIEVGQSLTMQACELHTVFVKGGEECVWLIEESIPTCEYFPVNYSNHDLTKWSSEGLYIEVGDDVKREYLKDLLMDL